MGWANGSLVTKETKLEKLIGVRMLRQAFQYLWKDWESICIDNNEIIYCLLPPWNQENKLDHPNSLFGNFDLALILWILMMLFLARMIFSKNIRREFGLDLINFKERMISRNLFKSM